MLKKVVIQGAPGSFAEDAAEVLFENEEIKLIFCPTLEKVREKIEIGEADFAVLPVENSLAGKVEITNQFLQTTAWSEVSSLSLQINQNLVACQAATIETIKTIESHPVALAQCQNFLAKNLHWQKIASQNTAASAKNVIESGDATRAAIANERTVKIYGGKILARNIADKSENYTKFLLLKR